MLSAFLFIGKGFGFVVDIAELAKWSVILLGRGFWLAIQLVPLCILYLGYSIASLLTFLIVTTYEQINACSLFLISKISAVGHWTVSYLFDFPLESVLGLVLGCLLIYSVNKFHDRILHAVEQSVRRSARLARTMLVCLWFIISQSRFQFPRRNAVGPPAVDSDSDSTQDDEPAVPVRRSVRLQTRRSDSKTPENPELLKRQLQMEKEEKLCVVCQDRNKCVIVIPCRHLCLCVDCSNIIKHTTHQCPICRQAFERGISVFM
ncbi:hypothetical protein B566_EDAN009975 [Ephemera danica]|nr:hypothetical protein B566_EDAN009975 [Ephemera danica]